MNTTQLFGIYEILQKRFKDAAKAKTVLFEIVSVLEAKPDDAGSGSVTAVGSVKNGPLINDSTIDELPVHKKAVKIFS